MIKYKLNLRKDDLDDRDILVSLSSKKQIPSFVDHTSQMSPVKQQGDLGACAGFAGVAMKEWQEKIENNEILLNNDTYDLSEQWLYYNAKKIDGWPNEEGTSIRYIMKVLNNIGVPIEIVWPYNDRDVGEPEKWGYWVSKLARIKSYKRLANLNEIKYSLITNGPLVAGIECFEEISYPNKDGLVEYPKNPNNNQGGHAICLVGYDDKEETLKFKNSWGTEWGNKGYGKLSYRYAKDFLFDAWEAIDMHSVVSEMFG